MKVMLFAAAALVWGAAGPAWADYPTMTAFENGNDLLRACESDGVGFCYGYIEGAADDVGFVAAMKPISVKPSGEVWDVYQNVICVPRHATARQVVDVVVAYLRQHPEKRDMAAPSLIASALREAFPCQ